MTEAFLTALASSFTLVSLAEIGDKSQLVCIALSARYRMIPVIAGVVTAFALLNALAVLFGAMVAQAIPQNLLAIAVAFLFIVFGVQSLREGVDEEAIDIAEKKSHHIFMQAFVMIVIAEFGDKTQLSVAALSLVMHPFAVWMGSTLALLATSLAAVWLGRLLLQRFDLALIKKASGYLFLLFGVLTLFGALY